MKIKGFTLIELLAVIIILGVILTITMVSVSKILSSSKSSLSDTQKKRVEEAAEIYYLKEGMNSNVDCVNISDLVSKGYVESKDVIDPKTRESLPGSVKITYDSNQYSYDYQENSCS